MNTTKRRIFVMMAGVVITAALTTQVVFSQPQPLLTAEQAAQLGLEMQPLPAALAAAQAPVDATAATERAQLALGTTDSPVEIYHVMTRQFAASPERSAFILVFAGGGGRSRAGPSATASIPSASGGSPWTISQARSCASSPRAAFDPVASELPLGPPAGHMDGAGGAPAPISGRLPGAEGARARRPWPWPWPLDLSLRPRQVEALAGLLAAASIAVGAAGCAGAVTSGGATAQAPPAQGGVSVAATPCGGSDAWPPQGYTERLPAGLEITSSGPLSVRVANSGAATIHVRVAVWGLGVCTGGLSFSPDRSADVPPRSSSDFAMDDPASGIPYRVAVEVWSSACGGACPGPAPGFWSGPLTQP